MSPHETFGFMASTFRIDPRFRGPPASGNGGYVAGLLARELGGFGCTVTLKAPPPLDVDLRVDRAGDGVSLWFGDRLVADAAPSETDIAVPPPPTFAAAADAERRFSGLRDHVFPGCFVCGPDRAVGDGMRIFAGSLGQPGQTAVACRWHADASLADNDGLLRSEFVWAALDCPGYFAVQDSAGPAVLGRLAVVLCGNLPVVCEPMIVTGWPIESNGRKHRVGTALHSADGTLRAFAQGTWISINAPDWQE